ncbi:MAG: response regulator transcription factor [Nitrospira sp.]|nr:response regulator transcription factor [Nitrospira sp.]
MSAPYLTVREREVLRLIWDGLQNKGIAVRLQVSIKTVEAHRAKCLEKFHAKNTAQLLRAALEAGVIS